MGRGNGIDFMSGLGEGGIGERRDQVGERKGENTGKKQLELEGVWGAR